MKSSHVILILLLGFVLIGIFRNKDTRKKIKYCHIDSVITISRNGLTPEVDYKYFTDCGVLFNKTQHKIGDSIKVK